MESIQFARVPGDIVVIRVFGRGTHQNSTALRNAFELTGSDDHCAHYVFDLERCTSMDSTFMGVLASIALRQKRLHGSRPTVSNASPHVREQLDILGLKYILDLREHVSDEATGPGGASAFESVPAPEMSKVDRIVLMIEAHERLIDVDGQNEIKFEGVLQSLRESLDRHKD